jgi:hypothetical protein
VGSFGLPSPTWYLERKGTLEEAQQMACHACPRTTTFYDGTNDRIALDEVEKIHI